MIPQHGAVRLKHIHFADAKRTHTYHVIFSSIPDPFLECALDAMGSFQEASEAVMSVGPMIADGPILVITPS